MANVKLGSKAVGDVVKLNVNGAAKEFIIIQQRAPSYIYYDDNFDGTWLLMKDIYENRQWHSSDRNSYADSTIHSYLNSTFLALFDLNIRNVIKQVKIPYRPGTGVGTATSYGEKGLSAKIFLLSAKAVNFSNAHEPDGEDACLAYFKNTGQDEIEQKRIAYYNGSACRWWLRSPYCSGATDRKDAILVGIDGYHTSGHCSYSYGIRPALILPSSLLVSDDGTVSTNTPPTITSPSGDSGVNLGSKSAAFSFTYTPYDEDGDKLSVVERLDGVAMKSRTGVASGTRLTFECASTDSGFREILNGNHTITIEVSDGTETTTFTAQFSKAVHEASITLQRPMTVEGAISLAIMTVVNSIPSDAVYKVEVTNNANDTSPVWQDVTEDVKNEKNIVFKNEVAANGAAFNFRITAKRGASGMGGYISAVSGAFQ